MYVPTYSHSYVLTVYVHEHVRIVHLWFDLLEKTIMLLERIERNFFYLNFLSSTNIAHMHT